MKITQELLERYNASPDLAVFLRENYPDGVEPMEIMENKDLPLDFMHFIVKYIELTSEETARYEELCKVKDSYHYFYSEDLTGCNFITNSKHISNSDHVRFSQNVNDSSDIYDSRDVKRSSNILRCIKVKKSNFIVDSKEISYSNQIYKSDMVNWSNNIYSSLLIEDSSFDYQSSHLYDCHFCGFMNGCSHCLFSADMTDAKYQIFNKEVSQREFELTKEKLLAQLQQERPEFIITDDKHNESRFKIANRFDSIFNGLSPEFYGWIGTLDGYSEENFLRIFLTK